MQQKESGLGDKEVFSEGANPKWNCKQILYISYSTITSPLFFLKEPWHFSDILFFRKACSSGETELVSSFLIRDARKSWLLFFHWALSCLDEILGTATANLWLWEESATRRWQHQENYRVRSQSPGIQSYLCLWLFMWDMNLLTP